MFRRITLLFFGLCMVLLLSACSMDPAKNPIDPSKHLWDKVVYPFSWTLDWLAGIFGNQYGIAILLLTILIRMIILPLTIKQYRSSKKMQALQPELKKLKEKYKDDAKKQQEETMKLFQSNGVNPLIVQMPILIALYHAIMRNGDIREHSFLWMQLGEKDPYFILPILAALTTFLQQKIMSAQTQMNNPLQGIMYIFPVLIFVMAMNFPSALPLYWIYSNTFTIVQTYFIYGGLRKDKGGLSQ